MSRHTRDGAVQAEPRLANPANRGGHQIWSRLQITRAEKNEKNEEISKFEIKTVE